MPLPTCPAELPSDLVALVQEFGKTWSASPLRPAPTPSVCAGWDTLLSQWVDEDLPLLVRKHNGDRGSERRHETGRIYIPTDNSAAHWAFTLACSGVVPSIKQIREWFAADQIPVVMIQKKVEKAQARYHRSLTKEYDVNRQGWKLGHIRPVGLNTRTPVETLPLARIQEQHTALIAPSNMFVVPLAWSGLAEVEAVIQCVAARR